MITLIRYLILTANVNRGSPTKPDWLYFSKKTFDILVKSGIIIQGKVKKCKRKREKVL